MCFSWIICCLVIGVLGVVFSMRLVVVLVMVIRVVVKRVVVVFMMVFLCWGGCLGLVFCCLVSVVLVLGCVFVMFE